MMKDLIKCEFHYYEFSAALTGFNSLNLTKKAPLTAIHYLAS